MFWCTPRDLVPWSACRGCVTTWATQYWCVGPTPSLQCVTTDRWGTVHLNSATSYVPSSLAVFWPFFGWYHPLTYICLINITLCPIRFGFYAWSHDLILLLLQRSNLTVVRSTTGSRFCPYSQSAVTTALWTSEWGTRVTVGQTEHLLKSWACHILTG